MHKLTALRLMSLIFSLAVVVWAIRAMDPQFMRRAMSAMGLAESTVAARIRLCPTRIKRIEWVHEGRRIEETQEKGLKLRWQAGGAGKMEELSYLEVEKWLGQYCTVRGEKLDWDVPRMSAPGQVLRIEFVNGSAWKLVRMADDSFVLFDKPESAAAFHSAELAQGWAQLASFVGL